MTFTFSFRHFQVLGVCALLGFAVSSCNTDPPTAEFTSSADGLEVSFSFTGEGDVDSYAWSFGDGGSSTSENPTHTYAAGGTYSVTLIAVNKFGEDNATKSIEVSGSSSGGGSNPALSFSDADGALYAINSSSKVEQQGISFTITLGTAVAWFGSPNAFESAGTVSWSQSGDSDDLDLQSNNSYTWTEPATSGVTSGFSASAALDWDVAGANGTPAFTYSDARSFPSVNEVSSATTIDATSSYTLTHNGSITDADSVYFIISGGSGSVIKRSGSAATSATFTAAELSQAGKGTAVFQVAAFSILDQTFGGEKIYFVKESVVSATGEIQ